MTLYQIYGFDKGPHWDRAFIEAKSPFDAARILQEHLKDEDQRSEDGVWDLQPVDKWTVKKATDPLVFVMGCGCR